MYEYRDWRLTLRLLAPLGTPMQSDTLSGHLCWQVAFAEGDEGVRAFLDPFLQDAPPFVLSDAFSALRLFLGKAGYCRKRLAKADSRRRMR